MLFFAAALLLGGIVRVTQATKKHSVAAEPSAHALTAQLSAVEDARKGKRVPPVAKGPIDVDVATEAELRTLPGIGPVMAKRIIADRDSLGPFGSLQEFDRVKGIGPVLLKSLAPKVTFSGRKRL